MAASDYTFVTIRYSNGTISAKCTYTTTDTLENAGELLADQYATGLLRIKNRDCVILIPAAHVLDVEVKRGYVQSPVMYQGTDSNIS